MVLISIAAMIVAPLLKGQESIFGYLQKMNGIYFIPIFAVVVVGMLNRRVPSSAAFYGLLVGLILIPIKYFNASAGVFFDELFVYDFHFLGFVFVLLVALMIVWGVVSPRPTAWKLENKTSIDLTPWKHSKLASLTLVVMVIAIYLSFAA